MSRRRNAACRSLLLTALLLAGCRKDSATTSGAPTTGGEVRSTLDKLAEAKRDRALLQAMTIAQAARSYWVKNGMPPANLELLVKPPDGKPFLQDAKDLIDPWGKPFQLAFEPRPDGTDTIRVFTTAPDGTRIDPSGMTK